MRPAGGRVARVAQLALYVALAMLLFVVEFVIALLDDR